ncbi:DUF4435 domain-containing protein [Photobacterium sp. GB-56]|uniref:DUF4435 domain-containing protein n=1 Tax=Photobacterium sp. GB-56 TaxID=2022106 RepID=UPI000D180F3D|nr:DUF4435 domain-containing protein [Photobacterium sp. GB-56]PSV20702.1 hypothetical protein C9J42_21130 [Photobacterium sp. GB-56]
MDFLDYLNKELANENIEHHLFLIGYNPKKRIVHCFFEGKTDESFYGTTIRHLIPTGYELKTYICGKKDSVLYHHGEIGHKTCDMQPLLFFIDKDIDDIIPVKVNKAETIYETGYYSIENYIVNSESLCQVWAEIYRQSSGTGISNKLATLFSKAHEEFNNISKELMAWVLFHRRKGGVRLNLDCIKTTDLFNIDNNLKLHPNYSLPDMYNYLDGKTKVSTESTEHGGIKQCWQELSQFEIKEISRGHNEMDFFIAFLKKLKEVTSNVSSVSIKPYLEISSTNVIDIMGPRIKPCDSLLDFLEIHFSKLDVAA